MTPWEAMMATPAVAATPDDPTPGWVATLETAGLAWRELPRREPRSRSTAIAVFDVLPRPGQPARLPHLLLVGLRSAGVPVRALCRTGGEGASIDGIPHHALLPKSVEAGADRVARWLDDLLPAWLADHHPSAVLTGLDGGLVTTAAALRAAAATGTPAVLRLDSRTAGPLLDANLVERAAWVVATDEETARRAVEAGVAGARLEVVLDPFEPQAAPAARRSELPDELGVDGVPVGLLVGEDTSLPLDFLDELATRIEPGTATVVVLETGPSEGAEEIVRLAPSELRVIRPRSRELAADVLRIGRGLAVDCRQRDELLPALLRAAGVLVLSRGSDEDETAVESLAERAADLVASPSRRLLAADTERARMLRERSPDVAGVRYARILARLAPGAAA